MDQNTLQTIIISAVIGLCAGIIGSWFQSFRNIKEKKFEILFEYRKILYNELHKITFLDDNFGQARYDWQINGVNEGKQKFNKEFKKWYKNLRDFFETSSWAIDQSVSIKLDSLINIAQDIDAKFWAEIYENEYSKPDEIDKLWFKLLKLGESVRNAIKETVKI